MHHDKLHNDTHVIKNIVSETIKIFKEHLALFLLISVIPGIFDIIDDLTTYYYLYTKPDIFIIISETVLIVMVKVWFDIVLIKTVKKIYYSEPVVVVEVVKSPKDVYWRYFGLCIGYYFITLGPAFALFIISRLTVDILDSFNFFNSLYWFDTIRFLAVFVISVIPFIYFGTKFCFVFAGAALEDKKADSFFNSKYLVRGNFWTVFCSVVLFLFLPSGIAAVEAFYIRPLSLVYDLILNNCMSLIYIFYRPIFIIFGTLFYLKLKETRTPKGPLPVHNICHLKD